MLSDVFDIMIIMRGSTDLRTEKVYGLSEKILLTSESLMRIINFIQLNRLAIKQILRNVDEETHAFESELFKNFFKDYYNQKDSQLKHILEHPGTLRAYAQVAYFINTIGDSLPFTSIDRIKKRALEQSSQNKNEMYSNNSRTGENHGKDDNELFQFNSGMNEPAKTDHKKENHNVREIAMNNFSTNVEVQPFKVINLNKTEEEMRKKIEANLVEAERNIILQENFFKQHQNNMFNQLGIKVARYDATILSSRAHDYYSDQKLEKNAYISIALDYNVEEVATKACYSMLDLYLVYLHTFLYILNYYGLGQTSPDYAASLNLQPSLSGILQAATPVAAIFFGFFINVITKTKYKFPYLLCLSMLVLGNLFYYLAETVKSNNAAALALLILGRMVFGMGGSRLMTRKFIAINVPSSFQSKHSTYLVGFSALGITLGPGISSMLEFVKPTTIAGTSLTTFNILSFVFFFVWLFLFIFFIFVFKGYDKSIEKEMIKMKKNEEALAQRFNDLHTLYHNLENRKLKQQLSIMQKNQDNFIASGLEVRMNPNYNPEQSFVPVEPRNYVRKKESRSIFKVFFPNNITFFSLWCFLIFKTVQEAYFTEQPQMTNEFFNWTSQDVGWFMLALTLVGVPTAIITGYATKKMEDRKILLIGFVLYIVSCLLKINYLFDQPMNIYHYFIASSILFCASLVGEAAAIAILAKVISPSLKLGFLNAGLLAGTADTLGRAIGNSSMTLFSSFR